MPNNMKIRDRLVKKGLVLGIIVLFIGASVTPSISGNISKMNNIKDVETGTIDDAIQTNEEELHTVTTVDWWPMFHHDLQHSGYSPSDAPDTNNVKWSYTTDSDVRSSPAVADGKVFVGSDDHKVYCLNAETGAKIWDYTTGDIVSSSPAVADGKVYIGSYDDKVYCLNADTGAKIWDYTTGDIVSSSPAVADEKVYVGSWDGKVYCLNANTGAWIWDYTTGYHVYSSPAVANGKVYIGLWEYKVCCLNANTGTKIWDYTTGSWVDSSPAVADGKVYIGSYDDKVYCLNANTGAWIWDYTTGDHVFSSPAVADGKVFVGSDDHKVYCLNAETGAKIWDYTTGSWVDSSPAVADGKVYIGSYDDKVYCLNADTGAKIWDYTTGDIVSSSPAVADGKVYIGSWDHKVYCFVDVGPPTVSFSDINSVTGPERHIFIKNDPPAGTTLKINGTAYDPDGGPVVPYIKIDNLPYMLPSIDEYTGGVVYWHYDWNITGVSDGEHTIEMKCIDNENELSDTVSKNVYINKMTLKPYYDYWVKHNHATAGGGETDYRHSYWQYGRLYDYAYAKYESFWPTSGTAVVWVMSEIVAFPDGGLKWINNEDVVQGDGFTADPGVYTIEYDGIQCSGEFENTGTSLGVAHTGSVFLSFANILDSTNGGFGDLEPVNEWAEPYVITYTDDKEEMVIEILKELVGLIPGNKVLSEIYKDVNLILVSTEAGSFRTWDSLTLSANLLSEHTYTPYFTVYKCYTQATGVGLLATSTHGYIDGDTYISSITIEHESAYLEKEDNKNIMVPTVRGESFGTITVDDEGDGDYTNIQDAIENAAPGDTIEVYSGEYYENIEINKEIILKGMPVELGGGNDTGKPVLRPLGDFNSGEENGVVNIITDNCDIDGFEILGNSACYGIKISNANYNTISNNRISEHFDGIKLCDTSSYNIFSGNNITDNYYGIRIFGSSNNNEFNNNNITFHRIAIGIRGNSNNTQFNLNNISANSIAFTAFNSTCTQFNNNEFCLNANSIILGNSSNNEISNNNFSLNAINGIYISGTTDNLIENNSFNQSGIAFSEEHITGAQNIIGNNINGKPIYFYDNLNGITVPNNAGQIILVNCTDFTVQGLNLSYTNNGVQLISTSNTVISNCTISDNTRGIQLINSPNNIIFNCSITDNILGGISLTSSPTNTVINNTFINDGIVIEGESQQLLNQSRKITPSINWTTQTIQNNTVNGKPLYYYANQNDISVPSNAGQIILANCSDFTIENTNISNVEFGMQIGYSSNNTILQNNLSNCSIGLSIIHSSNNNLIYHNFFINNKQHTHDNCSNSWDNGSSSGGNFWDDYGGVDIDGDGIGDTPYDIAGGTNQDQYPLGYFTNNIPFANFTYTPSSPTTSDVIQFNDTSHDINGSIYSWYWEFGDGNTSIHPNPIHQYADNGTYVVNLTVADEYDISNSTQKTVVVSNVAPFADFLYGPLNATDNDTIHFFDFSYDLDGMIVNWTWDFDDGNISYIQHPTHNYTSAGNYSVNLTVRDNDGENDTISRDVFIADLIPPEISNVQAIPPIQNIGGYVNISATVIDDVEVDEVYLYIEYPDSSVENVNLKGSGIGKFSRNRNSFENFSITQNRTGDTYYCNKTYQQPGTYTYHIWANDTSGNNNVSADYIFEIINQPPDAPSDPSPSDGATGVDIDADLSWSCIDPDGHSLTYDVYFEADDPTPDVLVSDDQSETTYDPGTLEYETTYYWQIIAKDEYGATTEGPIWEFTTEELPEPDLECSGSLSWTGVSPGETVTGSFTVENIGISGSKLDWEVKTWPSWGTWSFDPDGGLDLAPEDGPVTVDVEVVAPNQQNEEFEGEVKIVNLEDPNDFCIIEVSLSTPVNQNSMNSQVLEFLQKVIQRFSMLE